MLTELGLYDVVIQPWQVEYDLAWAVKPHSNERLDVIDQHKASLP